MTPTNRTYRNGSFHLKFAEPRYGQTNCILKFRLLFGSKKAEFRLMGLEPDYFVLDRPSVTRRNLPSLLINSVDSPPVFLLCSFGHHEPFIPSLAFSWFRTSSLSPLRSSPSLSVRTRPANSDPPWTLRGPSAACAFRCFCVSAAAQLRVAAARMPGLGLGAPSYFDP